MNERDETYNTLFRTAASGDREQTLESLRSAMLFGLPETPREHFIVGFILGRFFDGGVA